MGGLFSTDNCKKMGLVFDDVVGIVDIINCKDVKIQVCRTRRSSSSLEIKSVSHFKHCELGRWRRAWLLPRLQRGEVREGC